MPPDAAHITGSALASALELNSICGFSWIGTWGPEVSCTGRRTMPRGLLCRPHLHGVWNGYSPAANGTLGALVGVTMTSSSRERRWLHPSHGEVRLWHVATGTVAGRARQLCPGTSDLDFL